MPFLLFLYLVSLCGVKLAESVRCKTFSMYVDRPAPVPDPVGLDGGDDGGAVGDHARPKQERPEEETTPHLCLRLRFYQIIQN